MQRKAAERIAHASDIAVLQILALMQAPDTPAPVKLAAARDLLDRANVTGKTTVELQVKPWEELLAGIVATVPEGSELRSFVEAEPKPDPLVIEGELANAADDYSPTDEDYSDPWAYGHDLPSGLPVRSRASKPPASEPAKPLNGDDRPPPQHPTPGPRRIEPDDDRPRPRRRVAGRR